MKSGENHLLIAAVIVIIAGSVLLFLPRQNPDNINLPPGYGANAPPNYDANTPPGQQGQPANAGKSFMLPDINIPQTLKSPPVTGEGKTLKLNDINISYNSLAASYSPITMGADLFITVKNNGQETETLYMTPLKELLPYVPNWSIHFFAFQTDNITLKVGEEKILHYFASNDNAGEFNQSIDFWQAADKSDKVIAKIRFYSGDSKYARPDNNAIVYGYVRDKNTNKTIAGADITINLFSGREGVRMISDNNGMYVIAVPSIDDVNALFGDQKAYSSLANFITVYANGYEYYYQGDVAPKLGEKLRNDLYLETANPSKSYKLNWESKVSDYYGFFWALVDDNWKYVVADQAKHTPQLDKPTNFYLFDANNGSQLWKYPTGNECWGIDITRDGSMVAAGCHDNYVYVVNSSNGELKWKKDLGGMNREVEFSHNGKYLLTGPAENYDYILYNSTDGSVVKRIKECSESLRNSKFTADDSKFVAGASFGCMAMFDVNGNKIWDNRIGEFPLFLAVDNNGNTYATGKGRTLFSFDVKGDERWSFRVPDHTAGTGAITPDGSRVAIGTVGGWVYYFDGNNGKVIWREKLPCVNAGHNAVSMSADGKYVTVGCAPEYKLLVFNDKGTKIFEYDSIENSDPILSAKWATIGPEASDGTQKGIMGTYTKTDGSSIVAAYGDDYLREFVWQ
ncbi:MAG: PQQ-binding-like beta-propeller repeat protein [Candidatus Aenigmatarchaeota archaeon]